MPPIVDPLLVTALLLNFLLLGSSRLRSLIRWIAWQGVVLGVLLAVAHGDHPGPRTLALAAVAVAMKAGLVPWLLYRTTRQDALRREVEPLLSFVSTLLLGGVGTGIALAFGSTLPMLPEHTTVLLVPAALATVFTGFLLMTTRRKAITQVIGYLTLENGVFLFGLTLSEAMPAMVEIALLLDLVAAIFVMGITVNHIYRTFSSADTTALSALRD
ncbi:MAG: hydrogenase [Deltaproteobacteria bacterium]|nr:hydrogenase [Deltaproteobacteria bacterium]